VTSPETSGELVQLAVTWRDILLALVVFWLPPSSVFTYLIWREVGKARGEMSRWKADAEADAAEGMSPGPPRPPPSSLPPSR
jgi:hypothetical protein